MMEVEVLGLEYQTGMMGYQTGDDGWVPRTFIERPEYQHIPPPKK